MGDGKPPLPPNAACGLRLHQDAAGLIDFLARLRNPLVQSEETVAMRTTRARAELAMVPTRAALRCSCATRGPHDAMLSRALMSMIPEKSMAVYLNFLLPTHSAMFSST